MHKMMKFSGLKTTQKCYFIPKYNFESLESVNNFKISF